jgi:hypothetical protein
MYPAAIKEDWVDWTLGRLERGYLSPVDAKVFLEGTRNPPKPPAEHEASVRACNIALVRNCCTGPAKNNLYTQFLRAPQTPNQIASPMQQEAIARMGDSKPTVSLPVAIAAAADAVLRGHATTASEAQTLLRCVLPLRCRSTGVAFDRCQSVIEQLSPEKAGDLPGCPKSAQLAAKNFREHLQHSEPSLKEALDLSLRWLLALPPEARPYLYRMLAAEMMRQFPTWSVNRYKVTLSGTTLAIGDPRQRPNNPQNLLYLVAIDGVSGRIAKGNTQAMGVDPETVDALDYEPDWATMQLVIGDRLFPG